MMPFIEAIASTKDQVPEKALYTRGNFLKFV